MMRVTAIQPGRREWENKPESKVQQERTKRWIRIWLPDIPERSYCTLIVLVLLWLPIGFVVLETAWLVLWFISENSWQFRPDLIRGTFDELFTGLDPFGFAFILEEWIESGFWERWTIGLCFGGALGAVIYCLSRRKGDMARPPDSTKPS